ncbi:MAG: Lrp/AsnC family transcriptional regulator [Clostridiales bacterium]|nr:Lrp/AsnC family transcriptional regulator [Clostridiales bacterium]
MNRRILSILKEDARTPHSRIAVMLGADEKDVSAAVGAMEREGIIVKYSALVNEEKTDAARVEALIEVKVSPMHTKGFDSIAEDVYQFDEVKSVYLMSGAYDLCVFIEGGSLREVASFVSEKLSVMDKVLSTATHFVLKKYKTDGVILEKSGAAQRLSVQP